MSALITYENYTQPFAGFGQGAGLAEFGQGAGQGQPQETWFKRNWTFLLQVVGLAFMAGGMVAKQYVDTKVPQTAKITPQDWEMLVVSVQGFYPKMPRANIERRLCEVFGTRAPFCADILDLPVVAPEPLGTQIPQWLWIAALGVGAVLLLK